MNGYACGILKYEIFVCGMLPMINCLVFGGILFGLYGNLRPFLLGFLVFGIIAVLVVWWGINEFLYEISSNFEGYVILPLQSAVGEIESWWLYYAFYTGVVVATYSLPQVLFAAIGGLLSRRFGWMKVLLRALGTRGC
ncbi:hypothetical protein ACYOEI_11645 [Singulisphaera rosea]